MSLIANHFRVCDGLEIAWSAPKLGRDADEGWDPRPWVPSDILIFSVPDLKAGLGHDAHKHSWGEKGSCHLLQDIPGDSHTMSSHPQPLLPENLICIPHFTPQVENLSLSLAGVCDPMTKGKSLPGQNCWDLKSHV